ncbi:MAG TPA: 3-phosphoshikimate 1-carboxyvinyltransferase [Xanthomonadales bacterium]|nr:3-phosphoshikimate 1-carboxyvinyltransferase [Xanthomonadales bacterium]
MNLLTQPLSAPLRGDIVPPGDKSISHRALIFSSLAEGESIITDLLQAEDVKATASACRQLGADIQTEGRITRVCGTGSSGLNAPQSDLDMGNSGTAMRLLAGVLAAQAFDSVLTGDDSLCSRPMKRIVLPLGLMGANIQTTETGTAPLHISGNPALKGIDYALPVASAQIKSCLMLAGLYASGSTCVTEPSQSRNHTEQMLPAYGVTVSPPCCVRGGSVLRASDLQVPADISSAAFFLVAAAMMPGSDLLLRNVGLNPTRDGIIRVLQAMGADLQVQNQRRFGEERVGDIRVRHAPGLRGIDVPESWIPTLIDELPAIMALASVCKGTTRITGAEELRVKESDRLAVMARGLEALGVELEERKDGITIVGGAVHGGEVDGAGDHRCAMSFAILGQAASGPVRVSGAAHINTSYPEFANHLASVGGLLAVDPTT